MRSGDSNGRSNLNILLLHNVFVQPWRKMSIRIHGDNLLLVAPLREGTDVCSRFSVGKVWLVVDIEVLAGYGKSVIDAVGAAMGANS